MLDDLVFIYLGIISFFLSFIIAIIASDKGRSGFLWFIISVFLSPLFTMLLLLLVGETREKRKEIIFEEEEFRMEYSSINKKQEVIKPLNPNGKTLNDLYSNSK
ncbi:MAG: hypothetical protein H6Q25_1198 [Bacteroidetes bacterium]|nr:hypothetical protein [Bacteroidota bacterium]